MSGFSEIRALPRWTILPGDPPALRRWLAGQDGSEPSDDWPQEEPS